MAISFHSGDDHDEDEVVSEINTTPLVDVMLVLLIIFLITIPVATHTVKVDLPVERNQPTQTKPGNIVLAVLADGRIYWNQEILPDHAALVEKLGAVAGQKPQPQIQIRGDNDAQYASVGPIVEACQEAGIAHVDFITLPSRG
ncbi:biopolymer transporter ExbD [Acetobacteraceae bacterium ESL0709]|nr:biopolymer transporter ExbD [Acetobacteraceae bacterium ESL0697]MDF7678856.1 biopolymer transporter ExbD [Acetobacteraceae bacterium ESL0709]